MATMPIVGAVGKTTTLFHCEKCDQLKWIAVRVERFANDSLASHWPLNGNTADMFPPEEGASENAGPSVPSEFESHDPL